jgi:hypothetical protein
VGSSSGPSRNVRPEMTPIDHRQAASSTLEIPLGFLRVCVLAWRRRWTPFPVDRHEKDH